MKNIIFLISVILYLIIMFSLTYYFKILTQEQCSLILTLSLIIILILRDLLKIDFFK